MLKSLILLIWDILLVFVWAISIVVDLIKPFSFYGLIGHTLLLALALWMSLKQLNKLKE